MSITTFLQSTAYIPALASRPFLAAFMVALLSRWGPVLPSDFPGWLQPVPDTPAWFTADMTLTILGLLALMEIGARKNQELRVWLDEIDPILKGVISLIVAFAVVDAESGALLGTIAGGVEPIFTQIIGVTWAGIMAVVTWGLALIRAGFYRLLEELDEGDDLGLRGALNWLEDGGVPFGVILATLLPIIAIGLFGLIWLTLWLMQKYIDHRETTNKIPCSTCGQEIHPAALTCHRCGRPNATPTHIGVFGQTKKKVMTNRTQHWLHLLVRKRCPVCATRLREKTIQQQCPVCQTVTFADAQAIDAYLEALQPTLGRTMTICFILGLTPILGLVPGIIYYRLSLVSSLRRYIPRRAGCLTRWSVRFLNLLLIGLQPVPILGAFTLPLMCYTNYVVYRKALQQERHRVFRGALGEPSIAS